MKNKTENGEIINILKSLKEIGDLCCDGKPDKTTVVSILKKLKVIISFDAATLYWFNKNKNILERAGSIGGEVELLNLFGISGNEGLTDWVANNQKPLLLADRSKKHNFNPDTDYASFMSAPLAVRDDIVGVINVGASKPDVFHEQHLNLLTASADVIVASLEVLLYKEQKEKIQQQHDNLRMVLEKLQHNGIDPAFAVEISQNTASIIHEINNSLSIIIGNIQCLLVENAAKNQKIQSRFKRMEGAAEKISKANSKILKINTLVNKCLESNEPKENRTNVTVFKNA